MRNRAATAESWGAEARMAESAVAGAAFGVGLTARAVIGSARRGTG